MPRSRSTARLAALALAVAPAAPPLLPVLIGLAPLEARGEGPPAPAVPEPLPALELLATAAVPLVTSGPQRSNAVAPGLTLRGSGPLAQKRQRWIVSLFAERVFSSDPRSTTLGLGLGLGWMAAPFLRLEALLEGGSRRVATVCDPLAGEVCPGPGWLGFGGGKVGAAWVSERPGLAFTGALHLVARFEFDGCFGDSGACVTVPGGKSFALQASAGLSFR